MKRFIAKLIGRNIPKQHKYQIKLIRDLGIKSVLDIAPPMSINLSNHINAEYTSIGLSGNHIDIKHDLNNFPYPFNDNSYDMVIMSNILEHLDDPMTALNEGIRITSKWLLIMQPTKCNPTTTNILGPAFSHKWSYQIEALNTRLKKKDQIIILINKMEMMI